MKYDNFDVNCTVEEAFKFERFTPSYVTPKCYRTFLLKALQDRPDELDAQIRGLNSIFVMGYVSGVRAERAKKKQA